MRRELLYSALLRLSGHYHWDAVDHNVLSPQTFGTRSAPSSQCKALSATLTAGSHTKVVGVVVVTMAGIPSVTTVTSVPPSWIKAFRPSSSEQVVMKVCELTGSRALRAVCSSARWSGSLVVNRTAWGSRAVSEGNPRGCTGASKLT